MELLKARGSEFYFSECGVIDKNDNYEEISDFNARLPRDSDDGWSARKQC